MEQKYKSLLIVSGVLLTLFVVLLISDQTQWAGLALFSFFLVLSFALQGHTFFKGFSFTSIIFAAVSLAMFFPQYFQSVGNFKLTKLITPLIQIIMFGMGTQISLKDFQGVIKMPKSVAVGLLCQFTIMPLVGFTLANIFSFPPEIAAGIILIGCSPSGLASNVMAYLAKANLALSVTITTIATLLAPFLTPFLMKVLGGEFIEVDFWKMFMDIIKMVIVPVVAGQIVNYLIKHVFKAKDSFIDKAMPFFSMGGIALIIVVITAAGRDNLLKVGALLIVVVFIHNIFGYLLGYWTGRLFKLPEPDCRTVALEVGMQNGGLASALANSMGKAATVGLAPAIFGPWQNISGSSLATWWKGKPTNQDAENKKV